MVVVKETSFGVKSYITTPFLSLEGRVKTITREKGKRPSCPECGEQPISRGSGWECSHCGRWYNKILRPRKYPPGMPCPQCGSTRTVKNGGVRVICRECGYSFSRLSRQQPIQEIRRTYG